MNSSCKWRKAQSHFWVFQVEFGPFTLFCSFVRVTVEPNDHNSAPAWRHDSENCLSVLKTSKALLFGEAKGPVSVLEHHKGQCMARKRLLLLLNYCHIALWIKERLWCSGLSGLSHSHSPRSFSKGFVTLSSLATRCIQLLRRWEKWSLSYFTVSPESPLVEK